MKGGTAPIAVLSVMKPGLFRVLVHVKPGARSNSLECPATPSEPMEVRLAAPPVEGKANKELVEYLEEVLHAGGRRANVSLVQGGMSRNKLVEIEFPGTPEELWELFRLEGSH